MTKTQLRSSPQSPSSHRHNALDINDHIITPHAKYLSLGQPGVSCIEAYRDLFINPLNEKIVDEITEATDKSWVLGSNDFKQEIEKLLNRRSSPKPRGGDRKSSNWQSSNVL